MSVRKKRNLQNIIKMAIRMTYITIRRLLFSKKTIGILCLCFIPIFIFALWSVDAFPEEEELLYDYNYGPKPYYEEEAINENITVDIDANSINTELFRGIDDDQVLELSFTGSTFSGYPYPVDHLSIIIDLYITESFSINIVAFMNNSINGSLHGPIETEEIVFRGTGLNGDNDWQTWEFKWSSQILFNLLKNIQDIIQSYGQFQNDQNFQDGDFNQNPPPFDPDNLDNFLDIKNSTRLGFYIVVYRDNNSIEHNLNFDYIELYPKFIGDSVHDFGVVGLDIVEKEMEYEGYEIFMEVATGLFFLFIIPLITLLYAISAVRDDIENHTIVYLITRPVTKAEILFYKFKGSFISAWIPIVISFSITFFIVAQKEGSLFIHLDYLGTFLILITLSILAYCVIFFIFSLITSYPIVLSLLYVFFWEVLLIPNQQSVINRFSIMFHIQSIAKGMLGDISKIELYQPLAVTESLLVLFGIIIGFFVLAIIIFNNRDFT